MSPQRGEETRRWLCVGCEDVSVLSGGHPHERCMLCDSDKWKDDGPPNWPASDRAAKLEEALVALIDAVDAKDATAIDRALFVGRGLTF